MCKQLKQSVKVVIDLLPQHLVERLYSTPTIKKQEVSNLYNKYYWSGCFWAFWVIKTITGSWT